MESPRRSPREVFLFKLQPPAVASELNFGNSFLGAPLDHKINVPSKALISKTLFRFSCCLCVDNYVILVIITRNVFCLFELITKCTFATLHFTIILL